MSIKKIAQSILGQSGYLAVSIDEDGDISVSVEQTEAHAIQTGVLACEIDGTESIDNLIEAIQAAIDAHDA